MSSSRSPMGSPRRWIESEQEFGEERLKALLRQIVHLPVDAISAGISDALKNWIKDAAQYDDLTFVVMKVS